MTDAKIKALASLTGKSYNDIKNPAFLLFHGSDVSKAIDIAIAEKEKEIQIIIKSRDELVKISEGLLKQIGELKGGGD